MRRILIFLIISLLTVTSCRSPEKSNEALKEAIDIYFSSQDYDSVKVQKSLDLTNRALDLDDHNIEALAHKTTLLFRKRDIDGLLQTVDELIKLRPEKPYYLVQKALYLEFKGDISSANEYYDDAHSKYQKHLKNDSLNFNLLLEYVGVLEMTGDTTTANRVLTKMETMSFDDSQKEILSTYNNEVYRKQSFSKELLVKYWKGEIAYEQIEEKLEGSR
jgi:tetratricopeptide (TPR) repeat protein